MDLYFWLKLVSAHFLIDRIPHSLEETEDTKNLDEQAFQHHIKPEIELKQD